MPAWKRVLLTFLAVAWAVVGSFTCLVLFPVIFPVFLWVDARPNHWLSVKLDCIVQAVMPEEGTMERLLPMGDTDEDLGGE